MAISQEPELVMLYGGDPAFSSEFVSCLLVTRQCALEGISEYDIAKIAVAGNPRSFLELSPDTKDTSRERRLPERASFTLFPTCGNSEEFQEPQPLAEQPLRRGALSSDSSNTHPAYHLSLCM